MGEKRRGQWEKSRKEKWKKGDRENARKRCVCVLGIWGGKANQIFQKVKRENIFVLRVF